MMESSSELEMGATAESFRKFLDSQRDLFHGQVDQLQNIVIKQCKLTGVNPLSQEMAAGAFSVKIGKRPRDLLNPKAVKYMQSVFSIKDAISKKESREISALFGVTVTQVRDFFASQRSRVRKFVRLSRERAVGPKACKELQDGPPVNSDSTVHTASVPFNSVGPPIVPVYLNSAGSHVAPVPLNSVGPTFAPVPLNSVGPPSIGEAPSCSTNDEVLPGLDDFEKHFIDNIFDSMRKEDSFSGQVKLLEWILKLQNSSILTWFLSKGGVMILATWLSQAALEEQTTVLHVILKVLCHLPLHKALPVHMSAILQSVNRLRFYRAQDVSNRARVLLSRWSKIFARSQAMRKPNAAKTSSDMHNELLLKQSIGEIMNEESWQTKADISVQNVASSNDISENFRKVESPQSLKLLPASSDDPNRKHIRVASLTHARARRKVQLVEQPGQKTAARSSSAFRAVPVSQGRPMSADDIQRAKTRALYMQSKYGKVTSASSAICQVKNEGSTKPSSSQNSVSPSVPSVEIQPKNEEHKDSPVTPSLISDELETPPDPRKSLDSREPSLEKCKNAQIPWHTPPEMRINDLWRVGAAGNSKEVEVQRNRIRREKETAYEKLDDIPPGPREPWDLEMDYDDSLTPEIPTEQLPDPSDGAELPASAHGKGNGAAAAAASTQISGGGLNAAGPDLELLAVLLKNPELVFSLTSGQGGGGLSDADTVKLLDMIKTGSVSLPGNSNGVGANADGRAEVSLPSPTPPSTGGWRPEIARNPFTQQRASMASRAAYASPPGRPMENTRTNNVIRAHSQSSAAELTVPPFLANVPPLPLHHHLSPSSSQASTLPEMRPVSRGAVNPTHSLELRIPAPELALNVNNFPPAYSNRTPVASIKPAAAAASVAPDKTERFPPFSPTPSHSQTHRLQQPALAQPASRFDDYHVGARGPLQPRAQPGRWERGSFHEWSSEGSPTRPGRNLSPQRRMSPGQYRRPDRHRQGSSPGHRDHNSRHGDRRWRDRDRDWRR